MFSWHMACNGPNNPVPHPLEGVWHALLIHVVCLQGLDTLREHQSFKSVADSRPEAEGQPKRLPVDLSQLSLQDTNEEEVGIAHLCLA